MRSHAAALFMLIACTAASADGAGSAIERIRERHRIVIAHRESSIPFSYLDDKGKPIGYALDICMHVVDAIRRELKLPRLDVAFSIPYFIAAARAVVRSDSGIRNWNSLPQRQIQLAAS